MLVVRASRRTLRPRIPQLSRRRGRAEEATHAATCEAREAPGNTHLTWAVWALGLYQLGDYRQPSRQKEQPLCPQV